MGNLTDGEVSDELANLRSSVSLSEGASAKQITCEQNGVRKQTEKRTEDEGVETWCEGFEEEVDVGECLENIGEDHIDSGNAHTCALRREYGGVEDSEQPWGVNLGVNRLFINTGNEVIDNKPVCGQEAKNLASTAHAMESVRRR